MVTLGGALARGLAGFMDGRRERERDQYVMDQQRLAQERQARLDEENRQRQAALMKIQADTLAAQTAERERLAQRQTEADARSAYEGGYRSLGETQAQGAALGQAAAGLQTAPMMGAAGVGLGEYADAMRQQREAFTMGGTPMAKVAESMQERRDRLAAQQREGEQIAARQERAAERAEDRGFTQAENAKNRAATLAGINARMAGSGEQQPGLRTLNQGVESALSENAAVLGSVLEAENLMASKGADGAFGFVRGAQNALGLANRMDPQGTELRALIANLGSQQIKLRSGAAVTAAEWPRLAPWIPSVSDSPAEIRAKLKKMREVIGAETNNRADYYEQQGYAIPTIPGRAARGGNVRNDRPPAGPMDDPDFVAFLRSKGYAP